MKPKFPIDLLVFIYYIYISKEDMHKKEVYSQLHIKEIYKFA